jgi:hypothetical protein
MVQLQAESRPAPSTPRSRALAFAPALVLAALGAAEARSLRLGVMDGWIPGVPLLARVEVFEDDGSPARGLWDAEAVLSADGFAVSPDRVTLRNGVGTELVTLSGGTGTAMLTASVGALEDVRAIDSLEGLAPLPVSGSLAGPLVEWSGIVAVTGPVTVPAGTTLRILPGTWVLVTGVTTSEGQPGACQSVSATPTRCGASITVRGALESLGTDESPVTITAADPRAAWGEVHHDDASPSIYRSTFIYRGGNSPRGGHTNTGPTLRATSSSVRLERSTITDGAGKAMAASGAAFELIGCVMARFVMGPEVGSTSFLFEESHASEFHGTDDNDGIYLHSQNAGQELILRGSVFADGDDDAIDTLGSDVTIEDCIIRDWKSDTDADTKGISVFSGEVTIRRTLVADCHVGIAAKGQGSGAVVHIEHVTVARCGTGILADDKFGEPDLRIRFFISNTIVRATDAIDTDYPQFPDDIQVRYSDLSEAWAGTGNIEADPMFASPESHDFHLLPGSPCIDAGDPASPEDPDATRADIGAFWRPTGAPVFTRGEANGDGSTDLADAVTILLHLFAGREIDCSDAADANDDGVLDLTDPIQLLDHLFRGGEAPPAPASCGADPTEDGLACGAGSC